MKMNKIISYVDAKTGKFLFSEVFYDPSLDYPEAIKRQNKGEPVANYGGEPLNTAGDKNG